MPEHELLPGRAECVPDEESPCRRRSPGRRPATGTPSEQYAASVKAGSTYGVHVDVSGERERREYNGANSPGGFARLEGPVVPVRAWVAGTYEVVLVGGESVLLDIDRFLEERSGR